VAGDDVYAVVFDAVYEPVLEVNASAPPALEAVFEGFGFARSFVRVAHDFAQEVLDFLCFFGVGLEPKLKILPSHLGERDSGHEP
jgi:hypothetical protein